jgi:hypothetical protein
MELKIPQKPLKFFDYAVAWLRYVSKLLDKIANIGNVVRDSFSDLHIPKKDDYFK